MTPPAPSLTLPKSLTLPSLTRADAHIARSFAARRSLPPLAGLPVHTAPVPAHIPNPVRFTVILPAGRATLIAPQALVAQILQTFDPAAHLATPDWTPLLLELAADAALATLAQTHPALAARLEPPPAEPETHPHALGLAIAGLPVRLDLNATAAAATATALLTLPPARQPVAHLTARLHMRAMAATVSLAELRAARLGHVVQTHRMPGAEILLVAGERFVWHARADGGALHVTSPRRPATDLEQTWMQDTPLLTTPLLTTEDSSLDDLPIRLSFELGQVELPLAELETLNAGHVFDLGRAEPDAVDILANGRRIGAGRVVLIAGAPGVQITRLAKTS